MNNNIVKRFFAEAEEGMETKQAVVVAAIAAVVLGSAFAIYQGIVHPNAENLVSEATSGQITAPTQQSSGNARGVSGGLSYPYSGASGGGSPNSGNINY